MGAAQMLWILSIYKKSFYLHLLMKRLQTSILLSLLYLPLCAQTYLPIEHLSTKDGLSYRDVKAIYQDSIGFLWFGTTQGLNRYDGVEFVTYSHIEGDSNSLPDDHISWIFGDKQGNLLIETTSAIYIFDPATNHFRAASLAGDTTGITIQGLFPVVEADGDTIMYGKLLPEEELYTLKYVGDGQFEKLTQIPEETWDFVEDVTIQYLKESNNTFWYWGYYLQSYLQWSSNRNSLAEYKISGHDPNNLVIVYTAWPINQQGRFFFPFSSGEKDNKLASFDLPSSIPLLDWLSFTFDNHQNVWLQSIDKRIFKYDVNTQQIKAEGEFNFGRYQLRRKIYVDEESTVWIPHRFGISKVKQQHAYFETYLNDPEQTVGKSGKGKEIYTMAEEKEGKIILLTEGVYEIDPITKIGKETYWKNTPNKRPFWDFSSPRYGYGGGHMITSQNGSIWFNGSYAEGDTTFFELHKYNPNTETYLTYRYSKSLGSENSRDIRYTALAEDQNGKIWLGFERLVFFDSQTERFYADSSRGAYPAPEKIMKRDGNFIWANTQNGLLRFNSQNDDFEYFELFEQKSNLSSKSIYSIVPYQGYVWVGTSEGLIRFNPENKEIITYTEKNGLSHKIIYTMLTEGDYLWMGTYFGLCKFNIHTGATKNYYVEDGLTNNEFGQKAAVKAQDGKMYFGSINGVIAFYPAQLDALEKSYSARLVWTKFSKLEANSNTLITYERYQLDASTLLELDYRDKTFTFRYALLSLSTPSENNYHYFLEGLEEHWNAAGNVAYATYHSIPAGTYTLHIKATDPRGNPSMNELAIPMIVYGPWWNKWWAYLLFGGIILGIIMGIRQYELKRYFAKVETQRLKELDHVKTRLYTNITHEFRTPLTVISGMAEQIMEYPLEAKEVIQRNSQQILRLVNQMLDLAKSESGNLPLKMIQADIVLYLQYLLESFHSYAESKDIGLFFYEETQIRVMDFDEEKLQSIISNLLSNAIKFSPVGSKIILHVKDEGQMLITKVKDQGVGISPEKLPYIFERFYQVDDSHTREGEGTGIGLTLSKELIELMGGSISVKSRLGEGSEFIFSLPIHHDASIQKPEMVQKSDLFSSTSGKTDAALIPVLSVDENRPLLLIIEDNADVIAYIRIFLQEQYQIEVAVNGAEGIEKALELIPDIIISDVMMPLKDGFEVCATLKQDERSSHIPIILLTAKADAASRIEGLERGADAYLAKPFDKQELLIRLQQLVELRLRLQKRYASTDIQEPADDKDIQIEDAFIQKVREIIAENMSDSAFGIPKLCEALDMTRMQLYRKFKALTNQSASPMIRSIRLKNAKFLLENSDLNVSEIAYDTGFTDPNHFSRVFKQKYGVAPRDIRK